MSIYGPDGAGTACGVYAKKACVYTQNRALRDMVAKAGDTMTSALTMSNNKVTGLAGPTAEQDAAIKDYVDAAVRGSGDYAEKDLHGHPEQPEGCQGRRHHDRRPCHEQKDYVDTAVRGKLKAIVIAGQSNNLIRFNKITIPNNKFQKASGQGSHWLIESPTIFHVCIARPYQISVNSIFKHIHNTSINTIIWQFVPFIYHPL